MDDTRPGNSESDAHKPHIRLAPIDHEEYDALAELFLGGGGYAPPPIDHEAADREPAHDTHTPVLHLTGTRDQQFADEQRSGSESNRPDSAGMRVLESLDATGDRASELLRELLEQADDEPHETAAVNDDLIRLPRPTIEVVVLGHLPVRATLWARQYACSIAREREETVALVRAAAGSTAIDLITGEEPIRAVGCGQLEDALKKVSQAADRVILRVDEASEPELLDRPEVETITILTGADEAAVVASYRLIKTLDASLGEQYGEDAPGLRLAVMGASHEDALDACTKLRNAVKTFISRPIEIVVGAGRIDATGTTNIYRDAMAHPASHIIDGLVRAAHDDDSVAAGPARRPAAAVPERDEDSDSAVIETRVRGASGIEPKLLRDRAIAQPRQTTEPSPEDAAPSVRDGLCALISGLTPLETRCPRALGVEMASDANGRLHLLVCDADTRDAMNRLYAAQNWARDHLALLLRAEESLAMPSAERWNDSEAMMHLISVEPSAMREIYDTPVRMYALARVRVGGVIAQVATPLN